MPMKINPGPPKPPPVRRLPVEDLDEVRLGGRNFIRSGDLVRVLPSKPGKRDGFDAKVLRIRRVDGTVEVDVFGGPMRAARGHTPEPRAALRTFRLDRLARRTPKAT